MIIGTAKYADVCGISDGYVRKKILAGKSLDGVISHQKLGKTHLLTIDIPSLAKAIGISERRLKKDLAD